MPGDHRWSSANNDYLWLFRSCVYIGRGWGTDVFSRSVLRPHHVTSFPYDFIFEWLCYPPFLFHQSLTPQPFITAKGVPKLLRSEVIELYARSTLGLRQGYLRSTPVLKSLFSKCSKTFTRSITISLFFILAMSYYLIISFLIQSGRYIKYYYLFILLLNLTSSRSTYIISIYLINSSIIYSRRIFIKNRR